MTAAILFIKGLFLNPLLEKEVRGTARTLRFFLFILAFLLIACVPLLVAITEIRASDSSSTGLNLFFIIYIVQSICVGLAVPAYACTAIAGERQHRTFDLLRITALQPWEIIWGKFIAVMSYVIIFILAFLPLVAVCFLYGGTDPKWITMSYAFLLLSSATAAMLCLMISAGTNNPIRAIVSGYFLTLMAGFFSSSITFAVSFGRGMGMRGMTAAPEIFTLETLIAFLVCVFLWSLFYIGATSLIKPASWNKSTAMRVWYAAFALVSLALYLYMTAGNANRDALAAFLISFVTIPAVFAGVGFCGEPRELPARLQAKVAKLPLMLWLFAPGRVSGAVFVRVVFLLTATAALLNCYGLSLGQFSESLKLAIGMFVYVNFCCTLAAATRSIWDSPRARIVTIATIIGVMVLPLLAFLFEFPSHEAPGVLWINPVVALIDFLGRDLRATSGPVFFFGFYLLLTLTARLAASVLAHRAPRRDTLTLVETH